MAALSLLAALVLACSASASEDDGLERMHTSRLVSPAVERWRPFIAEASCRFGIPQMWIATVMAVESAGQTRVRDGLITSRAGAMGLMQLMPRTWDAMRLQYDLGANPYDPHDNIIAGTAYLRAMYDQFGFPGMFAAYNAGPARYSAYLDNARPLPLETRAYLAKVTRGDGGYLTTPSALSRSFIVVGQPLAAINVPQSGTRRSALFFALRPPTRPVANDAAPSLRCAQSLFPLDCDRGERRGF